MRGLKIAYKEKNKYTFIQSFCVCLHGFALSYEFKGLFLQRFQFYRRHETKSGRSHPTALPNIGLHVLISHKCFEVVLPKKEVLPSFPQGMDHNNMQYCYMQQCTDMAAGQVIRTLSMNYEDPRYSIMASEV